MVRENKNKKRLEKPVDTDSDGDNNLNIDESEKMSVDNKATTRSPAKTDVEKVLKIKQQLIKSANRFTRNQIIIEKSLQQLRKNRDPKIDKIYDLVFGPDFIHENFQLLETRREALTNAVQALADSKNKDWGAYSEKVTEIFKQATHLAIWSWGRNNNKNTPLDLKPKSKINWELKPMQDLVALTIAKTIGYDLSSIKAANEGLAKIQEELENIRASSGTMVSGEFNQTTGLTLVEFANQWKAVRADLEQLKEESNAPKVNS